MQQRILIIAREEHGQSSADLLRHELDLSVELLPNRRAALAALRRAEYSLILLDESLATSDEEAVETLYEKALATPVLELNFAISNPHRVLRQVRAAFARRAKDLVLARKAAKLTLQGELRSSLTGLLLESQLALREVPPSYSAKLHHLVELAGDLRDLLCV